MAASPINGEEALCVERRPADEERHDYRHWNRFKTFIALVKEIVS
jgi:hypothetical protein